MSTHRLVVTIGTDGWTNVAIECPHEHPRPCAGYEEGKWPDDATCRCADPACPCRQGDHGGCSEFGGYVADVGPMCRCEPMDECWYSHAVAEVGGEMLHLAAPLAASWPVSLVGSSFDEPIRVELLGPGNGTGANTGLVIVWDAGEPGVSFTRSEVVQVDDAQLSFAELAEAVRIWRKVQACSM